jgi:hypothetical protein
MNQRAQASVPPRSSGTPRWFANVCIVIILAGFIADTLRGFPSAPGWLWLLRALGFVIFFMLVSGNEQIRLLGSEGHIKSPGVVRLLQVLRLLGLAGLVYVVIGLALRVFE